MPFSSIINILSFSLISFKGASLVCSKTVIKLPKLSIIRTCLSVNNNKFPSSEKLKSFIDEMISVSHKNLDSRGLKTAIKPDLSIKYK